MVYGRKENQSWLLGNEAQGEQVQVVVLRRTRCISARPGVVVGIEKKKDRVLKK